MLNHRAIGCAISVFARIDFAVSANNFSGVKREKSATVNITVVLDTALLRKLDQVSTTHDLSRSQFLRRLLRREFAQALDDSNDVAGPAPDKFPVNA